ncbi:hypothetical protein GCM10029964_093940 [Kibdelosporangium lantanae]
MAVPDVRERHVRRGQSGGDNGVDGDQRPQGSLRARRGRSVGTDVTVTEGCPGRVRLANVIPEVDCRPADSVRLPVTE